MLTRRIHVTPVNTNFIESQALGSTPGYGATREHDRLPKRPRFRLQENGIADIGDGTHGDHIKRIIGGVF